MWIKIKKKQITIEKVFVTDISIYNQTPKINFSTQVTTQTFPWSPVVVQIFLENMFNQRFLLFIASG